MGACDCGGLGAEASRRANAMTAGSSWGISEQTATLTLRDQLPDGGGLAKMMLGNLQLCCQLSTCVMQCTQA